MLQQMQHAVRAAGTGRYVIRVPLTGAWRVLSIREIDVSGDVSRAHFLDRMRPPVTQAGRETRNERILVGKREAFRSTYGGWICSVNNRVHEDDFSLLLLPPAMSNAVILGEEHIAGAIAWHVTAHSRETFLLDTQNTRLDFYIDEKTMLLLRQDRAITWSQRGRAPVTSHFRMSYSGYGETMHIALPRRCRAR